MATVKEVIQGVLLALILQYLAFAVWGIFDFGVTGPYVCNYIDSQSACSLFELALSRMTLMNFFFLLPTIISTAISFLILKIWHEGITLR